MKKYITHRTSLIIIVLCLLNFSIRIPFFTIPAYEDETMYFEGVRAIASNGLNPFSFSWKPPVIFMFPAVFFRYFSPSLLWGRIEIAVFSSLALFYIYKLTNFLAPTPVPILVPLLLFFYPDFMVQSVFFTDAIPFTALFLMSIYYYITNKLTTYTIVATLLVMTKETGIFLAIAIYFYTVVITHFTGVQIKKTRADHVFLLLPICVFITWMIINKILFGSYISLAQVAYFTPFSLNLFTELSILRTAIQHTFIRSTLGIIGSLALLGILYIRIVHRFHLPKRLYFIYFLGILFVGYGLFHAHGPHISRYFLFLYAISLVIFSVSVSWARIKIVPYILLTSVICVFYTGITWHMTVQSPFLDGNESSFSYLKDIQFRKKSAIYLLRKYSNTNIISQTFEHSLLGNPLQGYVSRSRFIINLECDAIKPKNFQRDIVLQFSDPLQHIIFVTDPPKQPCPEIVKYPLLESICYDNNNPESCIQVYAIR